MELRVSLVVVEKAYIPAQASPFEIWTPDHLDELVATAQAFNPALRGFVVITRVSPNPLVSEAEGARTILADYAPLAVAHTIMHDRIAYRRSGREGLAVVRQLLRSGGHEVAGTGLRGRTRAGAGAKARGRNRTP